MYLVIAVLPDAFLQMVDPTGQLGEFSLQSSLLAYLILHKLTHEGRHLCLTLLAALPLR